jgi:PKD repeat protein
LYFPDGSTLFQFKTSITNFAGWRALSKPGCSFDPHSRAQDPRFINASGNFSEGTDFQLQPNSPAIDAGVSVGLSQDRQGTPIPQGFAPDIGAYEYVFASNPLVVSASVSPTSGNAPLTVNFGASASGGSSPYTFSWNFGDGQTSTAQDPSHTYSIAGNFNATLTVIDSLGSQDSKTASITVTTAPSPLVATASASPTSGQVPLTVNFFGSASGGSPPYSYNWNFGNGGTSGTQNPVHTYSAAGNFTATLTVSDALGSSNSKSVAISVTSAPNPLVVSASAIPTSGQAPLTVNFTGSASGGTSPYSYVWNFGDGQSSNTTSPSHTYSSAGNYIAILSVTDSQGVSGSKSASISVVAAPSSLQVSASATPTSGKAPLAVNFTGTAAGGVPPYTYSWAFGDGGTSSVQNTSHTYLAIGGYAATLTVTDSSSSQATSTVNISVGSISSATLSISSETGAPSPGQGGTTDPSPGNHSYPIGSSVLAKSIPNTDFRFSKWGGDVAESSLFNSEASVTMDKSKSIAATFCTNCGDVNGDLKITPSDAQAAFDIFLGRIANPTWCEKENADVNSSGTKLEPKITPADAQVIFNKYLRRGEISGDCTGNSRSATTTMALGMEIPNATLTVNGFAAKLGEDIYVPILVDSPSEISAFGFDLEFPADKLIFIRLERTALTESFDRVDANVILSEYSDEKVEKKENYSILRVGGYKTDLTFNASSGVLVTLVFRVERDLAGEAPLAVTATYDDIKHASVKNGLIKPKNRQNERERLNKRLGGKRLDF